MAANTVGLNQVFQIYNEDGTPFHGLVLRKGVVDSIVMSLGDKITGDVFYKDNTLQVTMKEYVEYNGIHFSLVNPPTIVREGLVADNGELKGMTKYSFEFYHPMYQLSNFPFTDVATKTGEEKYLSQNKSFSWIGKPQDYIDKLNKNLQGTVWYVRKSDRFPVEKNNELSGVLTFDNVTVADAIKTGHETWDIPYVVSQLPSTDPLYAQGKRFVVEYGLPSNEIYESDSARQLDEPFVFHMGQGVGLKNNSRTPRNNKIVTRIAGYGSEDNVPYGYPQIVWTGNQDWDYTINNNPDNPLSYPIYKGIVGGQYVKLIKHPFTRTHLMPSIFTETVNKKVNPNAVGYDPTIEIKDYYDAIATQEYQYANEINPQAPSYESHEFADIKPELDADRNTGIVSAIPLNADLTPADHWDDSMDDDGNYLQSYFQITLPQLSFDLYACAAITQEMQINMRSGDCIGCTFTVQVDWDDYKRNFYDEDGNFVPDGEQRDLTKYPKSNLGQISVVVQKDNSTFGTLMPNIYQQPKANDLFVFIGISLPLSYITNAEERLDDAMKTYMLENNVYYFDYPLKFDEHFLATHTYILEQIRPNSIIHFDYGGVKQQLFVKQLTVKYGNAPLPQYDITLTDNVEVVLNQIGQVADDVEKLSYLIAILRQSYNRNVWNELAKKLSKTQDDTAQGFIRFMQGLQVGSQFVSGILGEGGVFRKDADGKTYIEADKMYVRMKAYFDSVEIREYQHTSGNRIASQAKGFTASRVAWLDADGNVTDNINDVVKFRCYWRAKDDEHEAENQFIVGDQAFMEYSDIVDGDLIQKRFWRIVVGRNVSLTEDGEAWIDLSNKSTDTIAYIDHDGVSRTETVQGYESGSSIPQPEDDICQLGNVWDTERQGAIIEYVSGGDAPSYQIFQGIDSFSLNGKNMVGLGYSSRTGKAYLNVYGDAYIGARDRSTFIEFKQDDGTEQHNPALNIKAHVEFTNSNQELDAFVQSHQRNDSYDDTEVRSLIDGLQDQIDGQIESWFYNYSPVVVDSQGAPTSNVPSNVEPYKSWNDADVAAGNDAQKIAHLGDTFTNNATGYCWRFSRNSTTNAFEWVIIEDSAVITALQNAARAQDTADHKRRVFLSQPVPPYDAGDMWVNAVYPANYTGATDEANHNYNNDILKCVTAKASDGSFSINDWALASKYTDDSKFNGYISALLSGSGASGDSATAAAIQRAVATALGSALGASTLVSGGLMLTSMIGMRQLNAGGNPSSISDYTTWGGISGEYNPNDESVSGGAKGHGIAAWYGGDMVDKEMLSDTVIANGWGNGQGQYRWAKSLFRMDGSGYMAGGNITWDAQGRVAIKDITTLIGSSNTNILNELTAFNNAFHFNTQQGTTTVLSIVPQAGFTSLNITENGTLKPVATQEWVGNNYLSIAFFNRLFQAYNGTTRVNTNDTTSTIDNIKAMFGFWTEQYISALGKNDGGGSSGGVDMTTVWSALSGNTNEQINLSHLTTALSGYATTSWVSQNYALKSDIPTLATLSWSGYSSGSYNGSTAASISIPNNTNQLTNGAGFITSAALSSYVTQVKVGTTAYNPSSGVVSLPAFVTSSGVTSITLKAGTGISLDVNNMAITSTGTRTITNSGVRATTINGNYLRVNTNGTNADLTIPYATSADNASNADKLDGLDSDDILPYGLENLCVGAVLSGGNTTLNADGSITTSGVNSDTYFYVRSTEKLTAGQIYTVGFYVTGVPSGNTGTWYFDFKGGGSHILVAINSNGWCWGTGTIRNDIAEGTRILFDDTDRDFYNSINISKFVIVKGIQKAYYTPPISQMSVASATKLQTARTINGTSFDGSDNITTAKWGTARNISIADSDSTNTGSAVSVNGSSAVTLKLPATIKATLSGNAATATKLKTARTIWGQSFDGSGNINGTIDFYENVNNVVRFFAGETLDCRGNFHFSAQASSWNIFENNNVLFRIVRATGNVGIGTTSPSYKLDVAGTFYASGDATFGRHMGFLQAETRFSHSGESYSDPYPGRDINFKFGGSLAATSLSSTGVIYSATGIFSDGYVSALGQNTSSDIRKKDIKENIALSVEDIAAAPSVKYLWKGDKGKGLQVGSIAQYWQNVLPEAVHEDNNGYLSMQYDVIALLSSIATARKVQDHERRIKDLEKENEMLRTEVEQLRA